MTAEPDSGKLLKVALLAGVTPAVELYVNGRKPANESEQQVLLRGENVSLEGYLIEGLGSRSDIDLDVLTFRRGEYPRVRNIGPKTRLHVLPAVRGSGMIAGWLPRAFAARAYLRKKIKPDVVHGMRTDTGYATIAMLSGVSHVITIEGFVKRTPRPWYLEPLFRIGSVSEHRTIKKAQNITVVSRHVARITESLGAVGRSIELPNMVEEEFYSLPLGARGPNVVYVGRIVPEKGLMDFLQAVALVDQLGLQARWLVIGGPTGYQGQKYLGACRDFARNLKQRVDFLGWVPNPELPTLLSQARCAVFPYRADYETFGTAVAEAMATGTPPIVYDFGPLPEHVEDSQSGYVVAAGDVRELADRIARFLRDENLSLQLGSLSRIRAQRYRKKEVIDQLVKAYREIARSRENIKR